MTHVNMYICNTKTGEHVQTCLPPGLALCHAEQYPGQDAVCTLCYAAHEYAVHAGLRMLCCAVHINLCLHA